MRASSSTRSPASGHRRLAIIDPAGGHQPVGTDDGRVQLTYNGEVYNFRELRAELEPLGHTFHTDVRHRGGAARLPRVGDRLLRPLQRHVGAGDPRPSRRRASARPARARARPLRHQAALLRALGARAGCCSRRRPRRCWPIPSSRPTPDRQWLYDYLLHGLHDHKPQTAFAGIRALAAATWAVVDADGVHEQTYWTPTLSTDAAPDPRRVPRPLRAVGGAATGRRRPRRHLPVGRDRLVVDRDGSRAVAAGARARRGVARRPPQDVLDRLRRRSHRRARVHGRGARRGRRRARVRGADVGAVRRRARPHGVAPGRADRVDRARTRSGA